MDAYIPALVWVLSAVICIYIAKIRHVKPTLVWALVVVFLGLFAIPLIMFIAKPHEINQSDKGRD